MKSVFGISVSVAVAALISLGVFGCSGKSGGSDALGMDESNPAGARIMDMRGKYITESRSYRGGGEFDSCTLTLGVSIDWPEAFGDYDISPLCDTIKQFIFEGGAGMSLADAVDSFLTSTDVYAIGIDNTKPVITQQGTNFNTMNRNLMVQRSEIDTAMVTFELVDFSYMGGAHPMTYTRAVTYSLADGVVLDDSNLFLTDSLAKVAKAINQTAAWQYNTTVGNLCSAGFFTDELPVSKLVSVRSGALVFLYNQYDVAPYSYGAVSIAVAPQMVESALTPLAKRLLIGN